jgi:hypothetical protein
MMLSLQPLAFSLQLRYEAEQHARDFVSGCDQRSDSFFCCESETRRQCQKSLDLFGGSEADAKESGKVWISTSAMAFGDVRGNRRTCPPQLGGQTELLFSGKRGSQLIDGDTHIHALLPDLQILIARFPHNSNPSTTLPTEGRRLTAQ